MHFSETSKLHTPARSLSLLLVLLAHLVAWQIVRQQIWGDAAKPDTDIVQYLQISSIPKPVAQKPAPQANPVSPEKIVSTTKPRAVQYSTPVATSIPTRAMAAAEAEPVSQPASPEADAKITPSLDLDHLRSSALALDRQRKPGEIEQIQASHQRTDTLEKRLGEGTKRAEKKECMKAFSGLGLLAVIPLAVSTVVDTGCKW